jgi:hypothetical protein
VPVKLAVVESPFTLGTRQSSYDAVEGATGIIMAPSNSSSSGSEGRRQAHMEQPPAVPGGRVTAASAQRYLPVSSTVSRLQSLTHNSWYESDFDGAMITASSQLAIMNRHASAPVTTQLAPPRKPAVNTSHYSGKLTSTPDSAAVITPGPHLEEQSAAEHGQ